MMTARVCLPHGQETSQSLTFLLGLVGALSPTHLSVVQKGCDGKIKWKPLGYHMGDIGSSVHDSKNLLFFHC